MQFDVNMRLYDLLHLISIMSFKLGHVSIPKRRIFLPLFLLCAYDSSVLQATVSLKVVSRKRRRKCTLTTVSLIVRIYDLRNRGKKMRLLGMDTCPSLNDIMEIRCNKCTQSEQGYEF
jgi:hypothetical protein